MKGIGRIENYVANVHAKIIITTASCDVCQYE